MKFIATLLYVAFILMLNWLFVSLPNVPMFGEYFSPADALVGIIYIVRDFAQRELKHKVIVAMLAGCGLSYVLADHTIAIASVTAFFFGESVDWAIFTFTQKPLIERLLWSSVVSSPIDSVVFLAMAHQLTWVQFVVLTVGKFFGILLFYSLYSIRQKRVNTLQAF